MDYYGPSSVLLAVITLLLSRVLIAAEIRKAHTGTRCNTQPCVYSKEEWGEKRSDDYLCLLSMIYDCPFQVEMGNTIQRQIHCIQRQDGKYQHRDQETVRTG